VVKHVCFDPLRKPWEVLVTQVCPESWTWVRGAGFGYVVWRFCLAQDERVMDLLARVNLSTSPKVKSMIEV
jgi:hypothetical protein